MTGQQLKNTILQEAIQGRLVPQDPNDEPASVLLDKIRKEKARLMKEGKLKKKDLEETPVEEDEKPFEIPESWEWVRVGAIFNHSSGKQLSGSNTDGALREYITTSNLYWGRFELDNLKSMYYKDSELEKCTAKQGDLLVCEGGDIGRSAIWPYDYDICLQNHVHRLRPYDNRYTKLVFYIMWYYKSVGLIGGKGIGIQGLSASALKQIAIPLPPLAEQKRIVAKIEEILPKVEEYGKAQDALDKLNEELPERLKKSILQEAIEGRLVPQDPNDEPASVLLDKIRKEKARLVKEGKLKKKDLEETPIEEDEKPFEIPNGWMWTRLGNHVSATSGLAYKKDDLAIYSNEYVRVLRGGNIFFGSWCIKDDDVMIGKQFVNDELILKKGMFISPAVTSLEHMGKTALIREDQKNIVAGGFVLMLIPHFNNETYWEYLNVLFQSGYYREKCKSITNKSGQAFFNLSRAKLLDLLIPLPPLAEQKRIVAKKEQLMKEIDKLKV